MSFETSAAEVIAGIDLSGKRAVVTGGASGIGVETARALAGAGAEVTLAVRDVEAGERVATEVGAVGVEYLELARLESVEAFTKAWSGPLHILVNNAGVMRLPELERTSDGWELQFATNHLGHFALAVGLHAAMASEGARIVSLSSAGHQRSPVIFDDINFRFRPYEPGLAYAQSKTANVLFAVAATQRWADDGIYANAVHPGAIHTNLARHLDPEYLRQVSEAYSFKTVEQGAATSVYVASSPELEGVGGRYYADVQESEVISERGPMGSTGVAPYALDPDNADRLWELSLAATQQRSTV
jgi:NAD(P)-dependent dehydrogenase (short-subunit alcohol dehydrogenase family)